MRIVDSGVEFQYLRVSLVDGKDCIGQSLDILIVIEVPVGVIEMSFLEFVQMLIQVMVDSGVLTHIFGLVILGPIFEVRNCLVDSIAWRAQHVCLS